MAPSVGSRFTRGRFNDVIVLMKIKTATGLSEVTVAVYVYLRAFSQQAHSAKAQRIHHR